MVMDGWMDVCMDRWMDGWVGRWVDEGRNGWVMKCVGVYVNMVVVGLFGKASTAASYCT